MSILFIILTTKGIIHFSDWTPISKYIALEIFLDLYVGPVQGQIISNRIPSISLTNTCFVFYNAFFFFF